MKALWFLRCQILSTQPAPAPRRAIAMPPSSHPRPAEDESDRAAVSNAPKGPGMHPKRSCAVFVAGGGSVTSILALADAPWWLVAIALVLGAIASATVLLAQLVMPQESEHKRDLWLALIHRHEHQSHIPQPRQQVGTTIEELPPHTNRAQERTSQPTASPKPAQPSN